MRLAALLITVGLLLSGCATPPPTPDPVMRNHAEAPVFKSDEDALAAAEEAYSAYLAVSDQIGADGGIAPERIRPYLTPDLYESHARAFDEFASNGHRISGASRFDTVTLQQLTQYSSGADVQVFLCFDISDVHLFDTANNDITPPGRLQRVPLDVVFEASAETIKIARSDPWSGQDFC